MSDNYDRDGIIKLSKSLKPHDVLSNIGQYNDEMTISQVVRFFQKHGIEFTKTMIQNYVRVNVMPPPVDRRYYIKDHLISLTLINSLKSIYSLDEIKKLFQPILQDTNTFDDDLIDMTAIYSIYVNLFETAAEDWQSRLPSLMSTIERTVDENRHVKPSEKNSVYHFVTILTLMAQSIATRQLAISMINDMK